MLRSRPPPWGTLLEAARRESEQHMLSQAWAHLLPFLEVRMVGASELTCSQALGTEFMQFYTLIYRVCMYTEGPRSLYALIREQLHVHVAALFLIFRREAFDEDNGCDDEEALAKLHELNRGRPLVLPRERVFAQKQRLAAMLPQLYESFGVADDASAEEAALRDLRAQQRYVYFWHAYLHTLHDLSQLCSPPMMRSTRSWRFAGSRKCPPHPLIDSTVSYKGGVSVYTPVKPRSRDSVFGRNGSRVFALGLRIWRDGLLRLVAPSLMGGALRMIRAERLWQSWRISAPLDADGPQRDDEVEAAEDSESSAADSDDDDHLRGGARADTDEEYGLTTFLEELRGSVAPPSRPRAPDNASRSAEVDGLPGEELRASKRWRRQRTSLTLLLRSLSWFAEIDPPGAMPAEEHFGDGHEDDDNYDELNAMVNVSIRGSSRGDGVEFASREAAGGGLVSGDERSAAGIRHPMRRASDDDDDDDEDDDDDDDGDNNRHHDCHGISGWSSDDSEGSDRPQDDAGDDEPHGGDGCGVFTVPKLDEACHALRTGRLEPCLSAFGRRSSVYVRFFERRFLAETCDFYRTEAAALLRTRSILDFVHVVHDELIRQELGRAAPLVHLSTLRGVQAALQQALVGERVPRLVTLAAALLRRRGRRWQVPELRRVHNLLRPFDAGVRGLQEQLRLQVVRAGQAALAHDREEQQHQAHSPSPARDDDGYDEELLADEPINGYYTSEDDDDDDGGRAGDDEAVVALSGALGRRRQGGARRRRDVRDARAARFIDRVWRVYARHRLLVATAFDRQPSFRLALDQGCARLLNGQPGAAVQLARYCDMVLDVRTPRRLRRAPRGGRRTSAQQLAATPSAEEQTRATAPKDTFDSSLDKVTRLFRYLEDKDVFRRLYARSLARRLLFPKLSDVTFPRNGDDGGADDDGRSDDDDGDDGDVRREAPTYVDDRAMLARLRDTCGVEYADGLQRMFNDVLRSDEESYLFRRSALPRLMPEAAHVDLNVRVLTASCWPLSVPAAARGDSAADHGGSGEAEVAAAPSASSTLAAQLPPLLASFTAHFTAAYTQRYGGRRLRWMHELSRVLVRVSDASEASHGGGSGAYELDVSLAQALLLLRFNDRRTVHLDARTAADRPLVEASAPLLDLGVLLAEGTADPPQHGRATFCVRFNEHFRSHRRRCVRVRRPSRPPPAAAVSASACADAQSLVEVGGGRGRREERRGRALEGDRGLHLQAVLVRLMKHSRRLSHAELVARTLEHARPAYTPSVADIKRHIDLLIDKEYIARASGDAAVAAAVGGGGDDDAARERSYYMYVA